jgi:signal transduction histidine kinase
MGLAEVAKVTVKDQAALELFEKVNETARNLDKMLLKLQSVSVAGSQELIYSEVLLDQIIQIELDNFRELIIQRAIRVLVDIKLEQPFHSYPVLVKFIIQNLLENSIAFCGTVQPYVKLKAYQVANETVLEVSDNGQGIESTYLNRVFDMYFRANERSRGNGLGLYIVKKMVDKLNGRIELKSELGFGTTMWVYLPNHFK